MSAEDPRAAAATGLRRYRSAAEQYLVFRARELGLHSTDLSALSHILDHARVGHALSPGELGQALALSGPATTAVIDRLERGGWVVRRHSQTDGRRIEVHLTARFNGKSYPFDDPFLLGVWESLEGFSDEQLQQFDAMITTLANRLEQEAQGLNSKGRSPSSPRSPRTPNSRTAAR